jgi:hypothetical protein
MTTITPDEEFIKKGYDKVIELIKKVYDTENPPLLTMIEELGLRYATCPASSHKNYYASFPGGLCHHNLNVLQWMVKLSNLLAPKEFSYETLLKVSILSEIGKVGDKSSDLYIPVMEEWKRKNGHCYDINNDLNYMKVNQRSLYLASQYGIPLTEEEYLAILLADPSEDANKYYKYKEPKLALILQFSNQWAQKLEKSYIVNWS